MPEARSKNGADGSMSQDADRLDQLEREHVEQLARAHEALAAAQDKAYWLDRWGVDLNELMLTPAGRRLRSGARVVRELKRGAIAVKRYASRRQGDMRETAAADELLVQAPIVERGPERSTRRS